MDIIEVPRRCENIPRRDQTNKESSMTNSKACSVCKQTKPFDEFRKNRTKKFGLDSQCKPCVKAAEKIWREGHKEVKAARDKAYRLANPEKVRARQRRWEKKNAEKEKNRKNAYYSANKDLWRERGRVWQKNNPDKENAKKRKWRSENPDKAVQERHLYRKRLKENGIFEISKKDWRYLLNQKNCFYCERQTKLTLEHVVPVSRGGRHSIGNLVMACKTCNSSKHARLLTEWKKAKNA